MFRPLRDDSSRARKSTSFSSHTCKSTMLSWFSKACGHAKLGERMPLAYSRDASAGPPPTLEMLLNAAHENSSALIRARSVGQGPEGHFQPLQNLPKHTDSNQREVGVDARHNGAAAETLEAEWILSRHVAPWNLRVDTTNNGVQASVARCSQTAL